MAGQGKMDGFQPWCRYHYNKYMSGVDIADQHNGTYQSTHRAVNYFWRRVFEQKLMQACTNAWLLFRWWLVDLRRQVVAEIKKLKDKPGVAADDDVLRIARLQAALERLDAVANQSRAQWLRALSTYLMSMCKMGHANRGKRKKSVPSAVAAEAVAKAKSKRSLVKDFHLSSLAAGQRFCCECKECSNRVNPKPARKKVVKASAGSLVGKKANKSYGRGKKVGFACRCSVCSEVGGVVMCFECYSDRDKHASAFESAKNSAKRRPVFQWGSKSSPV